LATPEAMPLIKAQEATQREKAVTQQHEATAAAAKAEACKELR